MACRIARKSTLVYLSRLTSYSSRLLKEHSKPTPVSVFVPSPLPTVVFPHCPHALLLLFLQLSLQRQPSWSLSPKQALRKCLNHDSGYFLHITYDNIRIGTRVLFPSIAHHNLFHVSYHISFLSTLDYKFHEAGTLIRCCIHSS